MPTYRHRLRSGSCKSNWLHTKLISSRRGFTLIELLAVLGILGALLAILLPAVQATRESARRASCLNNLKNVGAALHTYEDSKRELPLGSDRLAGTEIAWSARLLPYLERRSLWGQIDFKLPFNAAGQNITVGNTNVNCYVCPSAHDLSPGVQNYGGIIGTSILALGPGLGPKEAFGCGALIISDAKQPRAIRTALITDGLSTTLCVGESVDRDDEDAKRWICGRNCFAQNERHVNTLDKGSLRSWHPAGAHGLFADGHAVLLHDQIAVNVLGAICTRNGAESLPRLALNP